MCGEWESQDAGQWGKLPFIALWWVPRIPSRAAGYWVFSCKNVHFVVLELARTYECVFQKECLEGLLYWSRTELNANDTTLVKGVSYLIYSLWQAPVQEQTLSAPHLEMQCSVMWRSLIWESSFLGFTCTRSETPQNLLDLWSVCCDFEGGLQSICFQKAIARQVVTAHTAVLDRDISTLCTPPCFFDLCQIKPSELGLYIVTPCHSRNSEV